MRIVSALLAGSFLLAAAAPSVAAPRISERGEARLAKLLEGRVAGAPVNCIPLHNIQSSEIIDGTAILYRVGSRLYVNRPEIGGSSLDRDDVLVTRTSLSQLCSIDTVQLFDRTSRFYSGSVGLGKFVPYSKPAALR